MVGDALEEFVKNLFANTFGMLENERMQVWNNIFSYFGNSNNPPDLMLRGRYEIEVKKVNNDNGGYSFKIHHIRSRS